MISCQFHVPTVPFFRYTENVLGHLIEENAFAKGHITKLELKTWNLSGKRKASCTVYVQLWDCKNICRQNGGNREMMVIVRQAT